MFSDIIENSTLYLLEKNDGLVLKVARVVKKDEPKQRLDNFQYGMNAMDMTIDIVVDIAGEMTTLKKLPANQSIAVEKNVTVCEKKEDLNRIVDSAVTASKSYLDGIKTNQKIVSDGERILKELNPHLAKEKERDDKIADLNTRMKGIEDSIKEVLKAVSKERKNDKL